MHLKGSHSKYESYTYWVIPHKSATAGAIQKDVLDKKEEMELIENELLQIITLFNYIQLILIFTSLIHFTKRSKRVNKSDECFY